MQDSFDLTTIIFLALAVFVIWRLRSVLGTRTGNERPPVMRRAPQAPSPANDSNVVRLDRGPEEAAAPPMGQHDPDRWQGYAEDATPLAAGFDAIAAADGGFDPRVFREGAKSAYEMIVTAFASGDRKSLKDLLSKDVYEGFVSAITEREKRGEKVETTFVSIDKAEYVDAQLRGRTAQVTVRFVSKLITATKDQTGAVIDGDSTKVVDVTDVWTFAREAGSRDPNWKLVATEAGH
ncbi:calcium-binding protein [Alsobacter metallidurans]|uniref:Large ribosomal subunit protein mL45 n=1 Tax=Alsobacter metallidurans TaxID=340221 RepID=A0A917IBJ9_9HYPH|nr:Tim44/TimA family putative adaptor protein [Alsobacter metallidurans]GGH33686.1 calcium-binding protein [Alsobacter metallidurans]